MTVHKLHARHYELPELVIYDEHEPCPYLPDQIARLPLRLPSAKLTPEYFDKCLAQGDRRNGHFLYRTACPACSACEPIRLDVERFKISRSQWRVQRRGDRDITTTIGEPTVDAERVKLFNKHRNTRGLAARDHNIDERAYSSFLAQSCCDTFEIAYRVNRKLMGVAICDVGGNAISAVYCYFDPDFGYLSPAPTRFSDTFNCATIGASSICISVSLSPLPNTCPTNRNSCRINDWSAALGPSFPAARSSAPASSSP